MRQRRTTSRVRFCIARCREHYPKGTQTVAAESWRSAIRSSQSWHLGRDHSGGCARYKSHLVIDPVSVSRDCSSDLCVFARGTVWRFCG